MRLHVTMTATARNLAPCAVGCPTCTACSYCGDMRPAPDKYQGWGGVSLDRLFQPASDYYFFDQGSVLSSNGASWSKTLTITNVTRPVSVALVWTDKASDLPVLTARNLVNDLDLRIDLSAGGLNYFWQGNNYYTSIDSCARDGYALRNPWPVTYDRKNNYEKVDIKPADVPAGSSQFTITVTAFGLGGDGINPQGSTPRQDFVVAVENAHQ